MSKLLIEKIEALKTFEKDIPAIVIVIEIASQSVVYMSNRGLETLNITQQELTEMGQEYHSRFFNPEDFADYAPLIFNLIERNKDEEMITFFQQVRQSANDEWKWYLSSIKIFLKNKIGNPTHVINYACPVDPKHNINKKVDRLLDEHQFLKQNQSLFNRLTKREREILKYMALDTSSVEISNKLHISEHTVNTHRGNIRSKLNISSQFEITKFGQSFALI